MQTEESTNGVGAGSLEDNEVIEVADDIQDDIAEAYDELAEKEESKPEVQESKEDDDLEADLLNAVKELEGKQPEVKAEVPKLDPNKPTAEEIVIKAPARFTAEEKELFNKLPPEIKQIADKAFKEQQADYTRAKQFLADGVKQLEAEKALNTELTKTMNRYLTKWGSNGILPEQAIMALASVQDELTNPDKEVRKSAYARLLVNSGLEPNDFVEILGGQVQTYQPQQQIQQPVLTEAEKMRQSYIDSLIARDQQSSKQQEEQQVLSVLQEIEQVREMKSPTGSYLYPKLHDQNFITQAKPLVLAIMETTGSTWGEAFKKAYATLVPDFQPIGQTRLPSNNTSRSDATIVRNSPTVRSNGQPSIMPDWSKDDGLSLEDDILASLELLKRGGSGQY